MVPAMSSTEWALAFARKCDELRPNMGRRYLTAVVPCYGRNTVLTILNSGRPVGYRTGWGIASRPELTACFTSTRSALRVGRVLA